MTKFADFGYRGLYKTNKFINISNIGLTHIPLYNKNKCEENIKLEFDRWLRRKKK